jgi:hypothetical protein
MKKSIKKYLKVGSIIIIKSGEMYKVTELLERKFKCDIIPVNTEFVYNYHQEFYYNIEMTIFNEVASNVG